MSMIPVWRLPRRSEELALVLAALGVIVPFGVVVYIGLSLSVAAAVLLVISGWVLHQRRTCRASVATVLVVVGLVLQVGYALTMPVAAVGRAG
jgi:prepilin signal peptidase PulO-like enzyme (type II secretory pathway)